MIRTVLCLCNSADDNFFDKLANAGVGQRISHLPGHPQNQLEQAKGLCDLLDSIGMSREQSEDLVMSGIVLVETGHRQDSSKLAQAKRLRDLLSGASSAPQPSTQTKLTQAKRLRELLARGTPTYGTGDGGGSANAASDVTKLQQATRLRDLLGSVTSTTGPPSPHVQASIAMPVSHKDPEPAIELNDTQQSAPSQASTPVTLDQSKLEQAERLKRLMMENVIVDGVSVSVHEQALRPMEGFGTPARPALRTRATTPRRVVAGRVDPGSGSPGKRSNTRVRTTLAPGAVRSMQLGEVSAPRQSVTPARQQQGSVTVNVPSAGTPRPVTPERTGSKASHASLASQTRTRPRPQSKVKSSPSLTKSSPNRPQTTGDQTTGSGNAANDMTKLQQATRLRDLLGSTIEEARVDIGAPSPSPSRPSLPGSASAASSSATLRTSQTGTPVAQGRLKLEQAERLKQLMLENVAAHDGVATSMHMEGNAGPTPTPPARLDGEEALLPAVDDRPQTPQRSPLRVHGDGAAGGPDPALLPARHSSEPPPSLRTSIPVAAHQTGDTSTAASSPRAMTPQRRKQTTST